MADADEDVIASRNIPGEDNDLSDETQDFRFLSILSSKDAKIPKRGEKDFEPHATALQSNTLAASRQAMYTALSYQRIHQPTKGYTMATYHPETNMAYAYNPRGPLFARMGQVLSEAEDPLGGGERRGQRMWLLPEEALYLLERGTIDVRWPLHEDDEGEIGLPMSLQGAYAMFIGNDAECGGSLTFERYSVYSGLKRMGYTVLRAPTWDETRTTIGPAHFPPARHLWQVGIGALFAKLFALNANRRSTTAARGPLVSPASYRSYDEIYRRLALIQFHDPTAQKLEDPSLLATLDPDFRTTYHVWKPGSTTFKKSAPGEPDFRIAVVNARETRMPSLTQLSALMETAPYDPPRPDAPIAQKIKHGYKNIILAVVDQGVVSYLRFSDAAFGREKLYTRRGKPTAGKKGQNQQKR